jgi:hypothetical protein
MLALFPTARLSVRTTTLIEELASGLLAHSGVAVIWDLHLAAAQAKRNGKYEMAASLLEIAEAAERLSQTRAAA